MKSPRPNRPRHIRSRWGFRPVIQGLESRQMLAGDGLSATYFSQTNLSGSQVSRIDPEVDFDWSGTSPDPAIPQYNFSARWHGQVEAPTTETYTFYTLNDDGVRLWVDGQLLVDDWRVQAPAEESGSISLQAGHRYDIRMEYYQAFGQAVAGLSWSSPTTPKQIIPQAQLYSTSPDDVTPGDGLSATYYSEPDLSGPSVTRVDSTIDFDWSGTSPDPAIPQYNFSARWQGFVMPVSTETYTFYTRTDDGTRLWVDGQLLVDDWRDQGATEESGSISLQAGQPYSIEMEYYQATADAVAGLSWSSPTTPKQIIPQTQLHSTRPDLGLDAPSDLTATASDSSGIDLTWSAVPGATGYSIERSPDGSTGWTAVGSSGADTTDYLDTALADGTAYYYRVLAVNDEGDSPYSAVVNAATATAAPYGLWATIDPSAGIDLTWADDSGVADGYSVEESPDGVTGWQQIGSVGPGANSYSAPGPFAAATTYYFRVRAHSPAGGYSDYSGVAARRTFGIGDAGFETDALADGSYDVAPTNTPWTFYGTAGVAANGSSITVGNPPAPQGSQVAFLGGSSYITQSVSDWAAGAYTLSVRAAQAATNGRLTESLAVSVDGKNVAILTPTGTTYGTYTTAPFAVIQGSHTIAIGAYDSTGGGNDENRTLLVDDVSISAIPSSSESTVSFVQPYPQSGIYDFDYYDVQVVRDGDLSLPLAVSYSVSGTAVPGGDYDPLPGTVFFAAGASTANFRIEEYQDLEPPILFSSYYGFRTVDLKLNPSSDYRLDENDHATRLLYGINTGSHESPVLFETGTRVAYILYSGLAISNFSATVSHGTVDVIGAGPGPYTAFYTPDPGYIGPVEFHEQYDIAGSNPPFHGDYTRTLYVVPEVSLDVEDDPVESADGSQLTFTADASAWLRGDDVPLGDGSVVEWAISSSTGQTYDIQTPTTDGVADCTINSSQIAGTTYSVDATVISVSLDGGPVTSFTGPEETEETTIVPGPAASITFTKSVDHLISDGQSTTTITLTARDAEGNLVADGTGVDWDLAGGGSILTSDTSTLNGKAIAVLQAGVLPEDQTVSATIDGYQASTTITSDAVSITLGVTGNVVRFGTSDVATVTATVTDAEGNPVPDGTPITWFSQKGTIVGDATVSGGVATATLYATGGLQVPGTGIIRAFVGSNVGSASYLFVRPSDQVGVAIDHPVLAGDATNYGSLPVLQADGTTKLYDFSAQTNCSVTIPGGVPNDQVVVTVGNASTPAGLLMVVGNDGVPGSTARVTLDAQGRANFRLLSTGALPPGQSILMPISVAPVTGFWTDLFFGPAAPITTFNVALQPAQFIAQTKDFLYQTGYAILTGESDTTSGMIADVGFSLIPVVGGYTDIRDMGKELVKLWPGGESPDWWQVGFSTLGIFGSFGGPEVDWIPTLLKKVAKLGPDSATFRAIWQLAKSWDFQKMSDLEPIIKKILSPEAADFRNLVNQTLVKNADDLDKLNAMAKGLKNGSDDVEALLLRINDDPTLGSTVARLAMEKLGILSPSQLSTIQDAGKLDDVVAAIRYNIDEEKIRAYSQYLNDVKTNPLTPIPFSSVDEAAIDSYLLTKGQAVEPNLLSQEWIDGRAGKRGDRFVDAVETEFKTVSAIASLSPDKLSGAIASRIMDGRSQATQVFVDVRGQAGMTKDIALRGVARAFGADNKVGGKIQLIRIIGNGFDEAIPRIN
jgi:hypothetical protein